MSYTSKYTRKIKRFKNIFLDGFGREFRGKTQNNTSFYKHEKAANQLTDLRQDMEKYFMVLNLGYCLSPPFIIFLNNSMPNLRALSQSTGN